MSSILGIDHNSIEIILVDNASSDGTQTMIQSDFNAITYIRNDVNIGVGARNMALKQARGSIIITLDDDVIGINTTDIKTIIEKFSSCPELGAINFRVVDPATGKLCNWVHHCDPEMYSDKEFLTYEITEGAVAFRAIALQRVGFYSSTFFLSHEGPDLALRILDAGYDVIYSNIISVLHYRSNLGRKTWLKYYFDTRNQFWLAARNFPKAYAVEYLARGLCSMLIYSIRDGYLVYWLKAVADGLRGVPEALRERKVLRSMTMEKVRIIDSRRPALATLVKSRLLRKGIRL